jgi:hypothetical protein
MDGWMNEEMKEGRKAEGREQVNEYEDMNQ